MYNEQNQYIEYKFDQMGNLFKARINFNLPDFKAFTFYKVQEWYLNGNPKLEIVYPELNKDYKSETESILDNYTSCHGDFCDPYQDNYFGTEEPSYDIQKLDFIVNEFNKLPLFNQFSWQENGSEIRLETSGTDINGYKPITFVAGVKPGFSF